MVIIHITSSTTLLLLYLWYLKTRKFQVSALIYYFIIMVLLSIGYFPSGGINGSGVIFAIIIYSTGLLVLPPRFFVFFSIIFITLIDCLFLVEYIFPELVTPLEAGNKMLMAKIITNTTFFMILGVLLYYFKKEYVNEAQNKRIHSERLSKEMEKLENSERYKTRFLNTIWSEMNAPLASIELILGKLENTVLSENQQNMLIRLNKNSELLKSILSDVVEVSKVGMRKASLRKIHFDLYKEILELIEVLESVEASGQAIYDFKKGRGIPEILIGDPIRLKQAISSLINSSIKFMKGNEVLITSELLLKSEKNCTIRFDLNCKGAGLSKRRRAQIFENFYNTDKQNTLNTEIDLDLLMPKNLIETMGGSISFSFDERNDFSFYFDLPFDLPQPSLKPK